MFLKGQRSVSPNIPKNPLLYNSHFFWRRWPRNARPYSTTCTTSDQLTNIACGVAFCCCYCLPATSSSSSANLLLPQSHGERIFLHEHHQAQACSAVGHNLLSPPHPPVWINRTPSYTSFASYSSWAPASSLPSIETSSKSHFSTDFVSLLHNFPFTTMDQPTSPNTVTDNNTSMTGVNSIRNNSSNTKPSENAPGMYLLLHNPADELRSYF